MEVHTGYHLGAEMVHCYSTYFDHCETELNKHIDAMKITNMQIKILSDFMNKLSHGKQNGNKVDFSNDETAKKYAYLIHLLNPTILEGKIHNLPVEERSLHQVLSEMIDQLRNEGIPDEKIDLEMILDRFNVGNTLVDVLSEKENDVIIQAIDAALKLKSTDLNEIMMKINNKCEDRSQMTEQGRKVVEMAANHLESINRKMTAKA